MERTTRFAQLQEAVPYLTVWQMLQLVITICTELQYHDTMQNLNQDNAVLGPLDTPTSDDEHEEVQEETPTDNQEHQNNPDDVQFGEGCLAALLVLFALMFACEDFTFV